MWGLTHSGHRIKWSCIASLAIGKDPFGSDLTASARLIDDDVAAGVSHGRQRACVSRVEDQASMLRLRRALR